MKVDEKISYYGRALRRGGFDKDSRENLIREYASRRFWNRIFSHGDIIGGIAEMVTGDSKVRDIFNEGFLDTLSYAYQEM